MEYAELNKLDFFKIKATCGEAEFMKLNGVKAICIASENGTYVKTNEYIMQGEQKVIKTN